jgi:hypothetical protein
MPPAAGAALLLVFIGCNGDDDDDFDAAPSRTVQLTYDDDSAERIDAPLGVNAGGQIAVRFTPPGHPAAIDEVQFSVSDRRGLQETTFGVRVYLDDGTDGSPGTALLQATVEAAASGGESLVTVDLGDHELSVDAGDFYVAMEWLTAPGETGSDAQFLDVDASDPDGRSYWRWGFTDPAWYPIADIGSAGDRDAMIRATVTYTKVTNR